MSSREAAVAVETPAELIDGRWTRMRAHKRIVANVKLFVEWEESNKQQSIKGFTMDVSHSGCLAVVSADLKLAQTVKLINRHSGFAAEARVVWRDPRTWDVGLELLKPDAGFWNL
jgi:hypothetical protein